VTDDHAPRLRRSILYMPGANERALRKATTLPADGLILDLEDAVAPEAKEIARERVCAAAGSGDYGPREVVIRVNALGTPWHDKDLRAAATSGADAILVPKAESVGDVAAIERALETAGAPPSLRLWLMIEAPLAVLRAADIAAAGTRLDALVLGTNDLASELGARPEPGRQPLLTAMSTCVLAARARRLAILDGVYNDTKDPDGFAAEARQARDLGFDGKTLVHPSQIGPCNEAFTPSDAELEHAQRVIAAFDEAEHAGTGVATVDGQMVENLHARQARWVIAVRGAADRA
jgi:citrate lyase subunit beta / citryl-CoA lyase